MLNSLTIYLTRVRWNGRNYWLAQAMYALLFLEGALLVGNLDGKQVIPCSCISFAHQLSENMFMDLEIFLLHS